MSICFKRAKWTDNSATWSDCSHRKFIDGNIVYRFKQNEEWITCSVDVSSSISVSNVWTMYSLGYYFPNGNATANNKLLFINKQNKTK